MKLLTPEIEKTLPRLYANENTPLHEAVAHLKIFDPSGRLTYYATEYDPKEKLFFGYVVSPFDADCDAWENASLEEFEKITGRFGLGLERDIHFKPTKIGKLFPHMVPNEARDTFDATIPSTTTVPA